MRGSRTARFLQRTHEVTNQSTPLVDFNVFKNDRALERSIKHFGGADTAMLSSFGAKCGSKRMMAAADDAENNVPLLRQFDPFGRRIDVIDYHPSYHQLMAFSIDAGCAAHAYNGKSLQAYMTRAALMLMSNQLEPGHCCPIVMTSAAMPVLAQQPSCSQWLEKIKTQEYDQRDESMSEKRGVTIGMSMTEKQGGSDVRANTTIAKVATDAPAAGYYKLTGHKWFTSAPMSDAFLTLAKTEKQQDLPSCFLVPRWLPEDGRRNEGFKIMRLKKKLADRSNASSEIEYENAHGILVGEEGKGVRTILKMVQLTRLDCALGAAGGARRAVQIALNHASERKAFGQVLMEQPLMENLLADLCVSAEACTLSAMRMASAYGKSECDGDEHEGNLFRAGVAILKYYNCKLQPQIAYECLEVLGGNGFVEDHPMAKLFRHSPLNSVWEGSGNVLALDVLRASAVLPSFLAEMRKARGIDTHLDALVSSLEVEVKLLSTLSTSEAQRGARHLVDRLALAFQASLLVQYGHAQTAKAFLQARIAPSSSKFLMNYGACVFEKEDARSIIQENLVTRKA